MVRRCGGLKELLGGVGVGEDSVDAFRKVSDDGRRVVAVLADVRQLVALLGEGLEVPRVEVHCHVQEVHHLPVRLCSWDLQAVVFEDPMELLQHQLVLSPGEAADSKAVISVQSDVDVEVLHLREEEQSNEVAAFCSVKRSHSNVKVRVVLLDPGGSPLVEDGAFGVHDDLLLLPRYGGEVARPGHGIVEQLQAYVGIESLDVALYEVEFAFVVLLIVPLFEPFGVGVFPLVVLRPPLHLPDHPAEDLLACLPQLRLGGVDQPDGGILAEQGFVILEGDGGVPLGGLENPVLELQFGCDLEGLCLDLVHFCLVGFAVDCRDVVVQEVFIRVNVDLVEVGCLVDISM